MPGAERLAPMSLPWSLDGWGRPTSIGKGERGHFLRYQRLYTHDGSPSPLAGKAPRSSLRPSTTFCGVDETTTAAAMSKFGGDALTVLHLPLGENPRSGPVSGPSNRPSVHHRQP